LIQHASHFHVRGACRGNGQATFERNTLDFGRILEVMRTSGYRGWLELEYCWGEGHEGCDMLAETIRFRDHLRALAA
jgi:sugar phosphate isomerase/epimerase